MLHCKTNSKTERVWIDWGTGDHFDMFEFDTPAEINAFLAGIQAASLAWNIDDFRLFLELHARAQRATPQAGVNQ